MSVFATRRSLLTALGAGLAAGSLPVSPATAQPRPAAPAGLDATAQLLKALSEAPGPSAFEEDVRKIVVAEYTTLGASIEYDGLGSVLATLPGAPTGPRVMVTAHMDEVGLMVQHITSDGFLRAKTLGGILDQALPDQRWTVLGRNGPVVAVSGLRTTHVLPAAQRGVVWSLDETFFDVGATSREEVEALGIRPGDGMAPLSEFHVMANGRYAGKAWDDRVGLGVMIAASRRIRAEKLALPCTVVWVATTQEEIGLRGAQTAVDKARPDLGISLEAGVSADYPAIGPTQAQERLGGGPGIFLLDSSMIPNRKLRDFVFDVARQTKIPLQPNVLVGYGEDGAEIQRYDSGRPAVNLTVPTRYLHGHTGIIQRSDVDHAVDLLLQLLTRLDQKTVTQLASFAP
jgi:putative aminopeptidase FrvX